MKKPELTNEESETYLKIVSYGNMDDMFEFGYLVGRERCVGEQIAITEERLKTFYHNKEDCPHKEKSEEYNTWFDEDNEQYCPECKPRYKKIK
jgi:hypothetical protein